MRNFLIVMLFSGLLMIFIAQYSSCPPPKVQYKYVPRSLDQLAEDLQVGESNFDTVFETDELWKEYNRAKKISDTSIPR
jgi:hypothetical protein